MLFCQNNHWYSEKAIWRHPMRHRKIQSLLWVFVSVAIPAAAWYQTPKQLSAREIFYSAPSEPAAKKPAAPLPAKAKEKRLAESAKSKAVISAPGSSAPAGNAVPVSYTPGDSVPLGLRYSILKRMDSGSVEVDPDIVFHSGDRIRLRVDVNTPGYLYIISRGSSGNWKPLFPSSEIAGGDNRAQKGMQYDIPPGYVFTFDEQPGKEKLFLVFSRQPVTDLEALIYSLSNEQKSKPKEPSRPESSKVLLAQANIQDGLIDRLRNVSSRDLIIEKVDETAAPSPSAPEKEKAVYVVNPSRSADARVVADVTLVHQ
jgi:hypothetical protein